MGLTDEKERKIERVDIATRPKLHLQRKSHMKKCSKWRGPENG